MHPLITPRLAVMMFLQFFVWGAWYVTAPLYLSKIGFGPTDFGWTYSVGPIAGMLSPFFVGMIVDRFFPTERVLGIFHLLGAAIMLGAIALMTGQNSLIDSVNSSLGTANARPLLINIVFFGHMLCYYPTLSLTNTLALHSMTNAEKQFPLIRVFGTIGWIAAGVVVSFLGWDADVRMFYLCAGSALLMGLYSFTLPHTPPPLRGKKVSASELMGMDALVLLKQPSYLVFMVSSFLICIPLAFYYQMAGKYTDHAGLAATGLKMSFGQMSEIFFMLVMPFFFARLGVKWMLFVGMLAWVVRYGLFAMSADERIPWMIITGIVLHGICYDFFFVTGQIYTDKVAPPAIRGQAQGMLILFTIGLGMFIGAQVAGRVESHYASPNAKGLNEQATAIAEEMKTLQAEADSATTPASRQTELNAQIDKLRNERSLILMQSQDWKAIWMVPAIFAGVILVLFTLIFRDTTRPSEPAPAH